MSKRRPRILALAGVPLLALAACGPEDLGSPGSSGDINIGDIDNSVTTPAPSPQPAATPATTASHGRRTAMPMQARSPRLGTTFVTARPSRVHALALAIA